MKADGHVTGSGVEGRAFFDVRPHVGLFRVHREMATTGVMVRSMTWAVLRSTLGEIT